MSATPSQERRRARKSPPGVAKILAFKPPTTKPSQLYTDLKELLKLLNVIDERLDDAREVLEEIEPSSPNKFEDCQALPEIFSLTGSILMQAAVALERELH